MRALIAALFLVSPSAYAQQGQYYHPEATEIIAADPNGMRVCQWWLVCLCCQR
jgi:hypothetical protein